MEPSLTQQQQVSRVAQIVKQDPGSDTELTSEDGRRYCCFGHAGDENHDDSASDEESMQARTLLMRRKSQDERGAKFYVPITEKTSQKLTVTHLTCIVMGIACAVVFYGLIRLEEKYMAQHHYFLGLEDLETLECYLAAVRIVVFQGLACLYCRYIASGWDGAVANIVSQLLYPVVFWLFLKVADARDNSSLYLQLMLALAAQVLLEFGANVYFRKNEKSLVYRLFVSLQNSLMHSLIAVTNFGVCLFPFLMLGSEWLHHHAPHRIFVSVVFPMLTTFLGRKLLALEFSQLGGREEFQLLELYVATFMKMVISKAMAFQARTPWVVATTLCIQTASNCASLGLDPLLFRWSRMGTRWGSKLAGEIMSPLRGSKSKDASQDNLSIKWLQELSEEERAAREHQDKFFEVVKLPYSKFRYIQPSCQGRVLSSDQVGAFPDFEEWNPMEESDLLNDENHEEIDQILLISWDGFICAAEHTCNENDEHTRFPPKQHKFDDEELILMLYWVRDYKTLGKMYGVHTFAECMGIGLCAISWPLLDPTRDVDMILWQLGLAMGIEVVGAAFTYLFLKKYYGLEMGHMKHLLAFAVSWTYIIAAAFMWMSELHLVQLFEFIEPIGCAVLRHGNCANHH